MTHTIYHAYHTPSLRARVSQQWTVLHHRLCLFEVSEGCGMLIIVVWVFCSTAVVPARRKLTTIGSRVHTYM